MAEEAGEKSQDPTPHRRQQAREEGQVVQSHDLSSAGLLVGSLLVLMFAGAGLINYMGVLMAEQLGGDAWIQGDPDFIIARWSTIAHALGKVLLPVLGLAFLLAVALNLVQVGILFLPEKALPDWSRIDPFKGLKRLFSLSGVVRLSLGMVKVVVVAAVAAIAIYNRRDAILGLAGLDLPAIALFTWQITFWTCMKIGIALFVLALIDYGFQRWKHEQDLKMTPQEVREEMRNLQGDPHVIARRKSVQRQLAMHRVSTAVPKADVVITNPTELAVAIQYDPETMNAPVVVAKGAGTVAQRIRKLALEHGIPIVERKPLAQALYRDVDVGRPIPDQSYAAVAEILAYVYQLKGKKIPGNAA